MTAIDLGEYARAGQGAPRSRRQMMCALLGLGLPVAWAADPQLPVATALADHLKVALQRKEPLLVMVSLPGCPFCKAVRESHLAPMQREQGLQVVQVDMLSGQPLRDFRGAVQTHTQQIESWAVRIAPTVLFFGRDAVELVPRLTGGYLPDFYGAYLDQRLEAARQALA